MWTEISRRSTVCCPWQAAPDTWPRRLSIPSGDWEGKSERKGKEQWDEYNYSNTSALGLDWI